MSDETKHFTDPDEFARDLLGFLEQESDLPPLDFPLDLIDLKEGEPVWWYKTVGRWSGYSRPIAATFIKRTPAWRITIAYNDRHTTVAAYRVARRT